MKFLAQPIKPFKINQKFGENKACIDLATGTKYKTCDGNNPPKGYKSLYGSKGHLGIDLKAYSGQQVYCACRGIVDFIDTQPRSGLDVRIRSEVNGEVYIHIYEHLQGHNVKVGQEVNVGDLIGWADNTGYSSGDHLHFELRKKVGGKWVSVDPLPLMFEGENSFALDTVSLFKRAKETLAVISEWISDYLRR